MSEVEAVITLYVGSCSNTKSLPLHTDRQDSEASQKKNGTQRRTEVAYNMFSQKRKALNNLLFLSVWEAHLYQLTVERI